jgi:cyclopropane fatty-acyl-phospholipid synthase-like methyltransferase
MQNAILNLPHKVDIVFSAYALHHLSLPQKKAFIQNCLNQLTHKGNFLLVDVILESNQSREAWLEALEEQFKESNLGLTNEEIAKRMSHPRADVFPESIATYFNIAEEQGWSTFEVKIYKGNLVFMHFSK